MRKPSCFVVLILVGGIVARAQTPQTAPQQMPGQVPGTFRTAITMVPSTCG